MKNLGSESPAYHDTAARQLSIMAVVWGGRWDVGRRDYCRSTCLSSY
ncbi:MAG: hypothetical protein ACJAWD_000679 [Methylophilaceae bacterium]|jgi:hypothetical protein